MHRLREALNGSHTPPRGRRGTLNAAPLDHRSPGPGRGGGRHRQQLRRRHGWAGSCGGTPGSLLGSRAPPRCRRGTLNAAQLDHHSRGPGIGASRRRQQQRRRRGWAGSCGGTQGSLLDHCPSDLPFTLDVHVVELAVDVIDDVLGHQAVLQEDVTRVLVLRQEAVAIRIHSMEERLIDVTCVLRLLVVRAPSCYEHRHRSDEVAGGSNAAEHPKAREEAPLSRLGCVVAEANGGHGDHGHVEGVCPFQLHAAR
mmetsp:Transcript_958/g.3373  ORF Transcript_958/g.3373 Transcript_958/m.3373 type:complete len:254 (+) Transcript_958:48-809(+)